MTVGPMSGGPAADQAPRPTPLHAWHVAAKAAMTPFAGWSLPLYYSSIIAEHMQVRRRAGLFDVCHMGRFTLTGPGAAETLSRLIPTSMDGMEPGRAVYSVLLNREGGIKDDLIIYLREPANYLLVVNAANAAQDWDWITSHLLEGATLKDVTAATGLVALQGPAWLKVVEAAGVRLEGAAGISSLLRFRMAEGQVAGLPARIMRTGYTGEDGVELMMDSTHAEDMWSRLLAAGGHELLKPCGLGARDTLRLEAGLLLHGHDMDATTTPYEAGLNWLVHLDKGPFVGREALQAQQETGLRRVLAGLHCRARAIPRAGDPLSFQGRPVGHVTSGGFSPVLGHAVALGYVPPACAPPGTVLEAVVHKRAVPLETVKRPFYKAGITPLPAETVREEGA